LRKLVLLCVGVANAEVETSPEGMGQGDRMSRVTYEGEEPNLVGWDVIDQHVPEINGKPEIVLSFAPWLPRLGFDFRVPDLQNPLVFWILVLKQIIIIPAIRNCLTLLHRGNHFLKASRL